MHHFSQGALVTGIAYDSVPNQSFSWVNCPTSTSDPNGNLPLPTNPGGSCISQTATSTNTTPATYYQLVKSINAPVAAIQGVDLFLFNKDRSQDMFKRAKSWTPGLFIGASAYPLDHYFGGLAFEPMRGFNITGGAVGGSETFLSKSSVVAPGGYSDANPSIPTSSHFKAGFFIMIGFDTNLFGSIFNGSIFQSVIPIGTLGSSTPAPAAATPTAP